MFLHCSFTSAVWYDVCRWLGIVIVLPPEVLMSNSLLVGSGRNKRVMIGHSIVWLAFVWVTWKTRNDRIFNNVEGVVAVAVELIKRLF
jgi:hypothetical protein